MMNYYNLVYTEPETLEKIRIAEAEGRFSDHLDPISYEGTLPVDEHFPFLPGPWLRFVYWCRRTFFLNVFTRIINRRFFATKITGRENLRDSDGNRIKNAVFVCNHVNKYDGLVVNYALGHGYGNMKIMVADFNNRPGFLGDMMRADGILPFKNDRACIKRFTDAINWYLTHKTPVLFFPEGSEWWCYKKPRPFMDGAFHFAAANQVPVIPLFITFEESGRIHDGVDLPYFTVHILPPLYPDAEKTKKENTQILKTAAYNSFATTYEAVYNEKL